jgi:hypothetical protein
MGVDFGSWDLRIWAGKFLKKQRPSRRTILAGFFPFPLVILWGAFELIATGGGEVFPRRCSGRENN